VPDRESQALACFSKYLPRFQSALRPASVIECKWLCSYFKTRNVTNRLSYRDIACLFFVPISKQSNSLKHGSTANCTNRS
jgi:hypothetical protein